MTQGEGYVMDAQTEPDFDGYRGGKEEGTQA
jgi:hypothetical protein